MDTGYIVSAAAAFASFNLPRSTLGANGYSTIRSTAIDYRFAHTVDGLGGAHLPFGLALLAVAELGASAGRPPRSAATRLWQWPSQWLPC